MFENFPYTNYHNLNLDWIIKKVQEAYGPDNPPPTFVMSVNGQTGDVIVYPDAVVKLPTVEQATWNIFRFANGTERGVEFSPGEMKRIDGTGRYKIYDEQNPPPYPVISVNGETGNVILYRSAYIALPTVQEDTWTFYRISSGTPTGIQFTAEKAQRISGSDRYDIYDAQNPPPYPVASVNGKTGIVTTPFTNPSESILDLDTDSPGDTWGFARNTLGGKATLYLDTTGNDVKAYIQYVSDDETIYKEYPLLSTADVPESAGVISVNGEFGVVTVYGSGISRSSTNAQTIDAALTGLETDVTNIVDGIAIMANGDTHPQVVSGQFVYVRNHSTLPDGLYRATAAIPTDGVLSASNLQADGAGGLNALQSQVDSLNSKISNHDMKVYFNDFTRNQSNTSWSWSLSFIYKTGNLCILSTGVTVTTASTSDYVEIGSVGSGYKPVYETRGVCSPQDGGEAKMITIDTDGKIKIMKPSADTYWFELVWTNGITN